MLRDFDDERGVHWRVWDINPTVHSRGSKSLRLSGLSKVPESWLCFECDGARRRLSPIPKDWETSDETTLRQLCAQAEDAPMFDRHPEA